MRSYSSKVAVLRITETYTTRQPKKFVLRRWRCMKKVQFLKQKWWKFWPEFLSANNLVYLISPNSYSATFVFISQQEPLPLPIDLARAEKKPNWKTNIDSVREKIHKYLINSFRWNFMRHRFWKFQFVATTKS